MKWDVGDTAVHRLTITKTANEIFGQLSHDLNPVHFSSVRMANTQFGRPIANGIQTLSCVGSAIVDLFATDETMPLAVEQHNSFLKPVFIEDTVEATVEVIENPYHLTDRDDEYWVSCLARNQHGDVVLSATFRIRVLYA